MAKSPESARERKKALWGYICQFCGVESPVRDWRERSQECPFCGELYVYLLAQDSEK